MKILCDNKISVKVISTRGVRYNDHLLNFKSDSNRSTFF